MKFWNAINKQINEAPAHWEANPPISWANDLHAQREPSSWVAKAEYDEGNGMTLTFKDGYVENRPDATIEDVKSFINAPSKGRWVHDNPVEK